MVLLSVTPDGFAAGPTELTVPKKPNFVFIIADDMFRDMFPPLEEFAGDYLTPNLQMMSREGLVFRQTLVSSPVCTPSRFSCLTGTYASRAINPEFLATTRRLGQSYIKWNTSITPETPNLAARLRQNGYTTGFVGKNHVIVDPQRRELEFTDSLSDPEVQARVQKNYASEHAAIRACGFDYVASTYYNNPWGIGPDPLAVHNLDWITDGGVEFINQHGDEPFFLYFATTTPHSPIAPERSWAADPRASAAGMLSVPPEVPYHRMAIPARLEEAGVAYSDKAANMLWTDDAVGALIDALLEKGVLENTYVIFFNDHGQEAKGTLYQEGVTSFSVVWRPSSGLDARSVDTFVSNLDFAPTILDLAGISYESSDFDGESFRHMLDGGVSARREFFFELGFARAVLRYPWKLVALNYPEEITNWSVEKRAEVLQAYNAPRRIKGVNIVNEKDPTLPFSHLEAIPGGGDAEKASTGARPGYYDHLQLYNLARDPHEMTNLADHPEFQKKLEEMKELLARKLTDLAGGFGALKASDSR